LEPVVRNCGAHFSELTLELLDKFGAKLPNGGYMENDFEIRLGRIRNVGDRGVLSVKDHLRTIKQKRRSFQFTGRNIARGVAVASQLENRPQSSTFKFRQRVTIKLHVAKPSKNLSRIGFGLHLKYLQRDGVDKEGQEGTLYSKENIKANEDKFIARSAKDRHQFRFIVSAENATALNDLKTTTRTLMSQVERDLGRKLDWVAVDHFNTPHPHAHIVLRGKDKNGKDLVIARDYLSYGMRMRAEDIVTKELGLRSEIDLMRDKHKEIEQDRWTSLDRDIEHQLETGAISDIHDGPIREKLDHITLRKRLEYLQSQNLAHLDAGKWSLRSGWKEVLQSRGKRGDIIKSMHHAHDQLGAGKDIQFFDALKAKGKPVLGVVIANGTRDELEDKRYLLIEDMAGKIWHVDLEDKHAQFAPPKGAVVEVGTTLCEPKPSDHKIYKIAKQNDGIYSEDAHKLYEPNSSHQYRLAFKRRLEALRRSGIVGVNGRGEWGIPNDFIGRVKRLEKAKSAQSVLRVKSWMKLETQIKSQALTWLDETEQQLEGKFTQAKQARMEHLREIGFLRPNESQLSREITEKLKRQEIQNRAETEIKSSKRLFVQLVKGQSFSGQYEKSFYMAQGRMAVIGNSHEFAIVPWRQELERHRERIMQFEMGARKLSWMIGKERGLGR